MCYVLCLISLFPILNAVCGHFAFVFVCFFHLLETSRPINRTANKNLQATNGASQRQKASYIIIITMEKFSNWRDKATGVAPFLQISNQTNVLKAALTVVSVVVRVPLLLILTHFLVILPNAPQFVFSSILYVLGVFSWDVQVTGVKKK